MTADTGFACAEEFLEPGQKKEVKTDCLCEKQHAQSLQRRAPQRFGTTPILGCCSALGRHP